MMSPDYSKRDYLLPKGCKDLIDVIKLQGADGPKVCQAVWQLPLITGDLLVSETTTVRELANLLGHKPYHIIADLMELGVFANVNQPLDFETVSAVVRKYGYTAKKPA